MKRSPYAISLVGTSGSGKTTLAERLIAHLSGCGYALGAIKHHTHDNFEIDTPGKDSWRLTQAGSVHTVIATPARLATVRTLAHPAPLQDTIATMTDCDLVVVEGYRQAGLPTIEVIRRANEPLDQVGMYNFSEPHLIQAVVSDYPASEVLQRLAQVFGDQLPDDLPVFALDDVEGIAAFVVARAENA